MVEASTSNSSLMAETASAEESTGAHRRLVKSLAEGAMVSHLHVRNMAEDTEVVMVQDWAAQGWEWVQVWVPEQGWQGLGWELVRHTVVQACMVGQGMVAGYIDGAFEEIFVPLTFGSGY